MQFHKQLIQKHDPDNNQFGDCWRASIACLLDVPVSDVPHPYKDGNLCSDHANKVLNNYLGRHNLMLLSIPFGDEPELFGECNAPNIYWLLLGQSSIGSAISHYVIMLGGKIIHSTNSATVIGPDKETNYYWATFLVHRADTRRLIDESL